MGKAGVIAVSVGVLALALVGGSHVVGGRIESGFRDAVATMNGPGLQVRIDDYRRGVFGAEAHTVWTLDDGDAPLEFGVRHRIDHGPLPAGAAAQIESRLVLPQDLAPRLDAALQGRAPLEVHTRVGWSGAMLNRITAPAWKGRIDDEVEIDWAGIQGEIALGGDGRQARGRVEMPLLALHDADGSTMTIGQVVLDVDSTRPPPYRFWTGSSSLALGRLALEAGGQTAFALDGLKIGAVTTLAGDLVNMNVDVGVDRVVGGGETVDALRLALVLERLDAQVLDAVADLSAAAGNEPGGIEAQQAHLMNGLLAQLPRLLPRAPALELKQLSLRMAEGTADFGARVAYTGKGDAASFDPATDLTGNLRLSLPRALLVRMVEIRERQTILDYVEEMEIDADAQDIEDAVRAAVAERLADVAEGGMLQDKDGLLSTTIDYRDGMFELNGRALSPGEFGALGFPF